MSISSIFTIIICGVCAFSLGKFLYEAHSGKYPKFNKQIDDEQDDDDYTTDPAYRDHPGNIYYSSFR